MVPAHVAPVEAGPPRSRLMSRFAVLVALAGFIAAQVRAEEPHLQFARALRENGLPDIAADYLQHLAGRKLPPDLAALVPLEAARARLDIAAQEGDTKKRNQQFAEARTAYEAF